MLQLHRVLAQTRSFVRWRSAVVVDPCIRPVAASLARAQPAFSISAKTITILNEPPEFYGLLLDMIRRAEQRIFISSLYIGSTETQLIETLHGALQKKPLLKLYFQLDLNRSTRPGPSSTVKLILPLIQAFPSRVHVSLFRSPSLRGVLAKVVPPRFNEGWGTWHAKIYGADDEVMISGANLNKSYFTNRRDRYLHFASQPDLAQYCFDFLQTISAVSYRLLPPLAPFSTEQKHAHHSRPKTLESHPHTLVRDGYILHWPHSPLHPHHIHSKAQTALSSFQRSQKTLHDVQMDERPVAAEELSTSAKKNNGQGGAKVLVFPIIQAGQFNIRGEESALGLLFQHLGQVSSASHSSKRPLVDLTSGYFGLYKPYKDLAIRNDVDTRIVVASPRANGFYGSKGLSGRIPEGYTLLEQRFMRAVKAAKRLWNPTTGRGVLLSEWERKGWTYHAKGIWVSPTHGSPPVLTLFGSTNLNARSAHIDTELSFVMVVPSSPTEPQNDGDEKALGDPNNSLRLKLADEIERIRMYAQEWKGEERPVRFWTKVIVGLVKGML